MYINFELLSTKKLDLDDYLLLQACKQNKTEDLGGYIESTWGDGKLWPLEQMGLIDFIKGKKSDSKCKRVRISKKGQELMEDLETPVVTENDLKFFDWLEKTYKGSGREVGNRKKTKMYIALFRVHSQIDKNRLAVLIQSFLNDERQMNFSKRLEYLFFKPSNVFQSRFDIEQSRLYQYYLQHQEQFDQTFKKYEEEGV